VAILSAVVVVVTVASVNDYQKEKQFRDLNAKKEDVEITVVRAGKVRRGPRSVALIVVVTGMGIVTVIVIAIVIGKAALSPVSILVPVLLLVLSRARLRRL